MYIIHNNVPVHTTALGTEENKCSIQKVTLLYATSGKATCNNMVACYKWHLK